MKDIIPINEKLTLTIEETAAYSNIGINTLRNIIKNNSNLPFIIYVGRKCLIKRKIFEKWINQNYIIK